MPFLAPIPEKKKFASIENLKVNGTAVPESAPDAVANLEAKVNGI